MCDLIVQYIDRKTNRETNTKALLRLNLDKIMKEALESPVKGFNRLLLRIEKLAAVPTADQQTDWAKITVMMNAIERTPWFIQATAGTEAIPHFTGVVEKINHELSKQALNDPKFAKEESSSGGERMRIMRDILFARRSEEEASPNDGDVQDDGESDADQDDGDQETLFQTQRQYGIKTRKLRGREFCHGRERPARPEGKPRRSFNVTKGVGESKSASYDLRCFNCGGIGCTVDACPEPKNQTRIEANLNKLRRMKKINQPIRHVNLKLIDSPAYLVAEAMEAKIFLEDAATTCGYNTNFFGSTSHKEATSTLDSHSNFDNTIFLLGVHESSDTTHPRQTHDRCTDLT